MTQFDAERKVVDRCFQKKFAGTVGMKRPPPEASSPLSVPGVKETTRAAGPDIDAGGNAASHVT